MPAANDLTDWNFRVMVNWAEGESWHEIHEVYYRGEGIPRQWTEDAVAPRGEDLSGLRSEIVNMLAACDEAILDAETGLEVLNLKEEKGE